MRRGNHVDEVRSATVEDVRPTDPESDTDTVPSVGDQSDNDGHSEVGDLEHPVLGEEPAWFEEVLPTVVTQAAFVSLDAVDLSDVFTRRARVLKSPPAFLKGAFGSCFRLSLQEAERGRAEVDNNRSVRAWKLFLLLPRLLLFRSCRGGTIPKKKLQDRFSLFARGEWLQLLRLSQDAAECRGSRRIRQARADSVEHRAERAQGLAQLGELSSARQALEGFLHSFQGIWPRCELSQIPTGDLHSPSTPSVSCAVSDVPRKVLLEGCRV